MSDLIIARFDNQFAASAARDQLLAHGTSAHCVHIRYNEAVGGNDASSSSPTTVVSNISNRSNASARFAKSKATAEREDPCDMQHVELTVDLEDTDSVSRVKQVLERAGANEVRQADGTFIAENPGLDPQPSAVNAEDVARSIEASRQGARLPSKQTF